MKAKVFSFIKPSLNSTVASTRIARFVAETLGLPLSWEADIAEEPLDVLILVNGAFAFCNVLEEVGQAVVDAERIIWIQNDYTVIPPKTVSKAESPFRKAFVTRHQQGKPPIDYWTTVEANTDATELSDYLNWNQLTFQPIEVEALRVLREVAAQAGDLFYYGAFREKRVDLFDRYFKDCLLPVTVSSTSKKFAERYDGVTMAKGIKRDQFFLELACHGLGLYIEDKKSSLEFHSPANRFYEMLSAGLPMVFQPEAETMLMQAGFDIRTFIVHSKQDLKHFMDNAETIGHRQRVLWSRDYVGELSVALMESWDLYQLGT